MNREPTIVRVSHQDGQRAIHGTGFLVDLIPDQRGRERVGVLTAHHNLPRSSAPLEIHGRRWEGDSHVLVPLPFDEILEYEGSEGDTGQDWALLRLSDPIDNLRRILNSGDGPITSALRAATPSDREFFAAGFHRFDAVSTDGGTIESVEAVDARNRRALHLVGRATLLGAPGFSGAPVQSRHDGQVIGLIRQGATNTAGNTFFAMDIVRALHRADRHLACAQRRTRQFVPEVLPPAVTPSRPPPTSPGVTAIPDSGPPPAGAPYDPETFAPRVEETSRAVGYVAYGKPALLWGPESFGKTWLLRHLSRIIPSVIETHHGHTVRVISVSLDLIRLRARERRPGGGSADAQRISFDSFHHELASQIGRAFAPALDIPSATGVDLFELALRAALDRLDGGVLLLAIDHADAILPLDFSDDFFFHLRGLAEDHSWRQLRLLVAASTSSGLLLKNFSSSPFEALSQPISLRDLDREAVAWLASTYKVACTSEELDQLNGLVGGHPYLVRSLMFEARHQGRQVGELALPESSVFTPFLDRYRQRFETEPELKTSLRAVWHHQRTGAPHNLSQKALHRLLRAGLIIGHGQRHRLRYSLYEQLAN